MIRFRSAAMGLALLVSQAAWAQLIPAPARNLRVIPDRPDPGVLVSARLSVDGCTTVGPSTVTRIGSFVYLRHLIEGGPCGVPPPPSDRDFLLGTFSAGVYTLIYEPLRTGPAYLHQAREFTVGTPPQIASVFPYDTPILEYPVVPGVYYEVARPGSGYMIDLLPKTQAPDFLFGSVYSYDAQGQPRWYSLGGDWLKGTPAQVVREQRYGSVTSPFNVASGGNCYGCPYTANQNAPDPTLGTLSLVQRGSFNLDVEWRGTTTRITRLNLKPEQLVGRWRGRLFYRDPGNSDAELGSGHYIAEVRRRTESEKIRFWTDENLPIPAATDIQFVGHCPFASSETASGSLCFAANANGPSPVTTFYHDARDGEFKAIIACTLDECRDATGAYKPSNASFSTNYRRVLMPDQNTLRILSVTGRPGQERIVNEEEYHRIR